MSVGQRHPRHIRSLCSLLGYSRQAFYQLKRSEEQRIFTNDLIIGEVLNLRKKMRKAGVRQLMIMLEPFFQEHNITIGRDALLDLLSVNNLLIRKRKRKVPRTTFSDHYYRKYPNLTRNMELIHSNQLWVSDITYIRIGDGFGYLSLITDAYSHLIVGYHLSSDLGAAGCIKALHMALKKRLVSHCLIHHSDRGIQYCCTEYVEILSEHGIMVSMTEHSDPRENPVAERVNGILKDEFLEPSYRKFKTASEAVKIAVQIYNYERPHSSIDMLTPIVAHSMTGNVKRRWKNYYKDRKQKEVAVG